MESAAGEPQPTSTEKFTCPPSENVSLGPLAQKILPHVFKLYNLSAGPSDYEVYSQDATFEDPLLKANGIKQIKSAFYSMQLFFSEAGIREYSVSETSSAESSGQIVVDNVQHYRALGREFDVVSRISLLVDGGLVVSHTDLWDKKPLSTGWISQGCRSVNMGLTHALMAFGRDRKPRDVA